jgi:diphthamide biosynthesis methyltransferase
MKDINFPIIETEDSLIEVKVIHNAENMFIAEISKLSIYEVGKTYREVEDKIRNSIRQTYINRNEF